MEINEVEVIPIAYRTPPLRTSWGTYPEFASRSIVRLTTEDGLVGVGETHGSQQVLTALERATPLMIDRNPYDRTDLKLQIENDAAYGALEMAMLDIIGKSVGEPVSRLLGGRIRESIEYGAYLFYKESSRDTDNDSIVTEAIRSPSDVVDEARIFAERFGFRTLKLKGGVLPPEDEIETLRLLAEEFGADVPLRIDPNGNWSIETTVRMAKSLEKLDVNLQFLEDPVPSVNAHRRLRSRISQSIATNMFVTSLNDIAPAVHADAVDVVLGEYHYCDGLTGVMHLDALARAFNLGTGVHSTPGLGVSLAAMTHLGAAMESIRYASDTHYPWFDDDVIECPFEFEDGRIAVPTEPGLGVKIDEQKLNRLNDLYHETEPLSFSNINALGTKLSNAETDEDPRSNRTRPQW